MHTLCTRDAQLSAFKAKRAALRSQNASPNPKAAQEAAAGSPAEAAARLQQQHAQQAHPDEPEANGATVPLQHVGSPSFSVLCFRSTSS